MILDHYWYHVKKKSKILLFFHRMIFWLLWRKYFDDNRWNQYKNIVIVDWRTYRINGSRNQFILPWEEDY